jgi:hypothetical protein
MSHLRQVLPVLLVQGTAEKLAIALALVFKLSFPNPNKQTGRGERQSSLGQPVDEQKSTLHS